jgi:hypothetical protein
VDDRPPCPQVGTRTGREARNTRRVVEGGDTQRLKVPHVKTEAEEVRPDKESDQDALRAYHLDRVVSKFKTIISAERAELLAALLGSDEDNHGNAA